MGSTLPIIGTILPASTLETLLYIEFYQSIKCIDYQVDLALSNTFHTLTSANSTGWAHQDKPEERDPCAGGWGALGGGAQRGGGAQVSFESMCTVYPPYTSNCGSVTNLRRRPLNLY